ncbi:MAG: DUF192 domain-containing protein, partial [Planctomycetes bacterium]|nr:DUF192 domain-containing protein [Planctomycetota bacterium]
RGLMHVRHLPEFTGMLFAYSSPDMRSMWMKNTYLSLDILFVREDGSPGRVDRRADVLRLGRPPKWETPLVVQVSRWDPLKDPVGVMQGFAATVEWYRAEGGH